MVLQTALSMSGLFGIPFHALQSPNLPVCSSKAKQPSRKIAKQPPAAGNHQVLTAQLVTDSLATSLPRSDGGQVPQPQPQDLDGATLAPCAFDVSKKEVDVLNPSASASLSVGSSGTNAADLAATPVATPTALLETASRMPSNSSAHLLDECQNAIFLVSPLHPDLANEEDNRDYSPVMDQLDETMVLLKSMQVAARAASGTQTPQPLSLAAKQDKSSAPSPALSFSSHTAQKEAWLAGYSSGLAHAHAQALCHIEELGNVQAHVAAQREVVDDLHSKHENLASQLSFLQGTCTQAFTGIWQALGRNTSMIEERLQAEASLQSRIDNLDTRMVVHSLELQQHTQTVAAMQTAKRAGWWNLRLRALQLPSHLLLQFLLGAAAAELLLRYSSVILGRRLRLGRNLMRKINALIAILSFSGLLLRATHAAFPALQNVWVLLRTISRPFSVLRTAAEKGDEFVSCLPVF